MKIFSKIFGLALIIQFFIAPMNTSYSKTMDIGFNEIKTALKKGDLNTSKKLINDFTKNLMTLNSVEKTQLETELKKSFSYETVRKINELIDEVQCGVLSHTELNEKLSAIARNEQSTGAAWESSVKPLLPWITIGVFAVVFIAITADSFNHSSAVNPMTCDIDHMLVCPPPIIYCFTDPETGEEKCSR